MVKASSGNLALGEIKKNVCIIGKDTDTTTEILAQQIHAHITKDQHCMIHGKAINSGKSNILDSMHLFGEVFLLKLSSDIPEILCGRIRQWYSYVNY